VFAEIATVAVIGEVFGIIKLAGAYDLNRNAKLRGDGQRVVQFAPRQAGRVSDGGE